MKTGLPLFDKRECSSHSYLKFSPKTSVTVQYIQDHVLLTHPWKYENKFSYGQKPNLKQGSFENFALREYKKVLRI